MLPPENDVIAAIATPIGEGGISIIRVSGDRSIPAVDRYFHGKVSLKSASSHTVHLGWFVDPAGKRLDQILATVFRRPHSYTGEDTVEIGCHGGMYVTKTILECLLRGGIRVARAGEFTQRAFLNGRIDLTQAEAVADLIHARSEAAHRTSVMQLQGGLSVRVQELRRHLLDLLGLLELELDFSEEGIGLVDKTRLKSELDFVVMEIQAMLETYRIGRVVNEGARVVLTGPPNAGKSSIFNALLKHERAIVTDIPGTTRDSIDASISIEGFLFTIVDTPGIRESVDLIEVEGIRRAEAQIANSNIVLFVVDGSLGSADEAKRTFRRVREAYTDNLANIILVVNKTDLIPPSLFSKESLVTGFESRSVSALTGYGIEGLKSSILEKALGKNPGNVFENSIVIGCVRHAEALEKASAYLSKVNADMLSGHGNEVIVSSLRQASESLGEIVGAIRSDDVLDNIFSKFCIGK